MRVVLIEHEQVLLVELIAKNVKYIINEVSFGHKVLSLGVIPFGAHQYRTEYQSECIPISHILQFSR